MEQAHETPIDRDEVVAIFWALADILAGINTLRSYFEGNEEEEEDT